MARGRRHQSRARKRRVQRQIARSHPRRVELEIAPRSLTLSGAGTLIATAAPILFDALALDDDFDDFDDDDDAVMLSGQFALITWHDDPHSRSPAASWTFHPSYAAAVDAQDLLPLLNKSSIISMARAATRITERQRRQGVAEAIDALAARRRA